MNPCEDTGQEERQVVRQKLAKLEPIEYESVNLPTFSIQNISIVQREPRPKSLFRRRFAQCSEVLQVFLQRFPFVLLSQVGELSLDLGECP